MSKKIKSQEIENKAQKLLRDARAAEWAILKAEEYQEKFELSNATIGIFTAIVDEMKTEFQSATLMERVFNDKEVANKHIDLAKTYFKQLSQIDADYRRKEAEYKKKLMDEATGMKIPDDFVEEISDGNSNDTK